MEESRQVGIEPAGCRFESYLPNLQTADGKFWVYILENAAGRFYIGHTDDLQRRLADHNSRRGNVTFTHRHGPWKLVWSEEQTDRGSAMRRERQIKAAKSAQWIRQHLLNGRVPINRD